MAQALLLHRRFLRALLHRQFAQHGLCAGQFLLLRCERRWRRVLEGAELSIERTHLAVVLASTTFGFSPHPLEHFVPKQALQDGALIVRRRLEELVEVALRKDDRLREGAEVEPQ